MSKYIVIVLEGGHPIGFYTLEAESRKEAVEAGMDVFKSEYTLSYRWSAERGLLRDVRITVKEVKESRFVPGVFTDWEHG